MMHRRSFLLRAGGASLATGLALPALPGTSALPKQARSLPLADVRLTPSMFLTAVEMNRRYLMSLDPDRLLHNFYTGAGLPPKGEVYAGWESDTIAGHTLGHYLTALSLLHVQLG